MSKNLSGPLVVLALMAWGCGGSSSGPLAPNTAAVLHNADGGSVTVESETKNNVGMAEFVTLPSGTKVTVLDDAKFGKTERPEIRPVRVQVEEGPRKGLTGTVNRQRLRP
jgi:hypothetical protein